MLANGGTEHYMDAKDCRGFEEVCCFVEALEHCDKFSGKATYLLVCNRPIGRLEGASDILYIGQSGRLDGRLMDYRSGDKKHTLQDYRIPDRGNGRLPRIRRGDSFFSRLPRAT